MNNDSKDEVNDERLGFRKSIASLVSSESSMSKERKEIIHQALKFNIVDIRSYAGYKGDMLVEITSMDPNVVESLKHSAEKLGLETVIKKNRLDVYELFCISPSSDIYDLK
jgi:hypothetical protein